MADSSTSTSAIGAGSDRQPRELGHEAMVMSGGWWENAGQHGTWLEHLAREARPESLLAEEALLLGARVGGGAEGASAWLAELRRVAARMADGDRRELGNLLDRLDLLAHVAVLVRSAHAGAGASGAAGPWAESASGTAGPAERRGQPGEPINTGFLVCDEGKISQHGRPARAKWLTQLPPRLG